jgi:tetratricopeptide (TPR) repeat protein
LGSDPELVWPGQANLSVQGAGGKSLKEILDSPVWLNLTDLLEMKNRVVNGHEGTHHTLFYAQSWILLHYLLNQNKLPEVGTYFDLVENQQLPVAQAVQQAFGVTPEQLDQQVKDYFHSLKALEKSLEESKTLPAPLTPEPVRESPLPMLVDEVADSTKDLPSREGDALVAEMALRIPEHREDAFAQLQKLADDPKTETAIAHRALAWGYVQKGDSKKAFEELRTALEINGTDPWSHFGVALAAYHSAQKGTYIQGLANTMESLHFVLDEFREFAEGYNILGWARLAGGGGNAAVEAMKIAVQLSPRDEAYQLRLARAYLAAKKFDEATGTLDRLQHSHDPQIAHAAAKDLEDLPFLKKYGVTPEEQAARKQEAAILAKQVEESELNDNEQTPPASAPKEPVIDKRPVKFIKGRLIVVDCSQAPTAMLQISDGRSTMKLRVPDFKSMTLIGAGEFSCNWKNLVVSANYREDTKVSGDLVSLEVQ